MSRVVVISMAVVLLGLGGCATTHSVDKLKDRIANLEAQVNDNSAKADSAQATAEEAKATADDARATAQEAGVCCVRNSERLDRMFEKAQLK